MNLRRAIVATASLGALALAAHSAWNLHRLRTPDIDSPVADCEETVDVLIPARDEEAHIASTVTSALAQHGVPRMSVTVLDDESTDATSEIVSDLAATDERLHLVHSTESPPPGWLGKTWACARLGAGARGDVLVFVDADVDLHPRAINALIRTLRDNDLAMVAPYPRQIATGPLQRLVQPLVTWSWIATMPVGIAERSHRPSLSAANGQLLVIDARAYADIHGHASVRGEVIEDVALMRALKTAGYRCATVDGSGLAQCHMYATDAALVDGYAKSLWAAFGGPASSIAVCSMLTALYILSALALTSKDRSTRAWGLLGYVSGSASRAFVARRNGEPVIPDALLHPVSIAAFCALNGVSWWRHRRGTNTWKGRAVVAEPSAVRNSYA